MFILQARSLDETRSLTDLLCRGLCDIPLLIWPGPRTRQTARAGVAPRHRALRDSHSDIQPFQTSRIMGNKTRHEMCCSLSGSMWSLLSIAFIDLFPQIFHMYIKQKRATIKTNI